MAEKYRKRKTNNSKKYMIISGIVVVIIISFIVLFHTLIQYNIAIGLMNEKKYSAAIVEFSRLDNYKDSKEKINECNYFIAVNLMNEKNYNEAILAFENLDAYKDSKEKKENCILQISTIKIGEYIQMGKYYDEPILWRCVDIDEHGPLMLADRILTIKSFDVNGVHKYADGTLQAVDVGGYRTSSGSNLWETSNIRAWLNATATAGNVTWIDGCPPKETVVMSGYNDYATEKGFLADGNFTASERAVINTVTQKTIINSIDANKLKVGGTGEHTYNESISSVLQNYDAANYHNVTDKMFLLDMKQLNKMYQNSTVLGTNYYIGKPTQKAVERSEYKDISLNSSDYWDNWSRTPYSFSNDPYHVRIVNSSGGVINRNANYNSIGVRPAFYIKLVSGTFQSGVGTESRPYVVK
jgi:hypothetical protein